MTGIDEATIEDRASTGTSPIAQVGNLLLELNDLLVVHGEELRLALDRVDQSPKVLDRRLVALGDCVEVLSELGPIVDRQRVRLDRIEQSSEHLLKSFGVRQAATSAEDRNGDVRANEDPRCDVADAGRLEDAAAKSTQAHDLGLTSGSFFLVDQVPTVAGVVELRLHVSLDSFEGGTPEGTRAAGADSPAAPFGDTHQDDVDALRDLLDMLEDFSSNDQRARYLLSCNWMRDRGAAVAERSALDLARLRDGLTLTGRDGGPA